MKRIAELRDLSDDHHTGLVLARWCKKSARADFELSAESAWKQVVEASSAHLEPHFRIEEQHLLPELESIGEDVLARRVREEHTALRAMLGSESVDRALLERFGLLLESHIRFEEREVFEGTQHRLGQEALAAISAACLSVPRACPAFLGL